MCAGDVEGGGACMRLRLCAIGNTQKWNVLSGLTFGR